MTNEALQALIDQFGERICVITFDNAYRLYIGYHGSPAKSINDVKLQTIGGVDFVCCPHPSNYTDDRKKGVTATTYHQTDCIQSITIMDEGFEDYRVDPAVHS